MPLPITDHWSLVTDFSPRHCLVTGPPGIGKTTLIQKVARRLRGFHPAGFITREIRDAGSRIGFELETLDGRRGLLAHIKVRGPHMVGRYGVDVAGFDAFLEESGIDRPDSRLVVVDEIGRMECLSDTFTEMVKSVLNSDRLLIASIALNGDGFIAAVKQRFDVTLFHVDRDNRTTLPEEILRHARSALLHRP